MSGHQRSLRTLANWRIQLEEKPRSEFDEQTTYHAMQRCKSARKRLCRIEGEERTTGEWRKGQFNVAIIVNNARRHEHERERVPVPLPAPHPGVGYRTVTNSSSFSNHKTAPSQSVRYAAPGFDRTGSAVNRKALIPYRSRSPEFGQNTEIQTVWPIVLNSFIAPIQCSWGTGWATYP